MLVKLLKYQNSNILRIVKLISCEETKLLLVMLISDNTPQTSTFVSIYNIHTFKVSVSY